jgi:hypothetical protein
MGIFFSSSFFCFFCIFVLFRYIVLIDCFQLAELHHHHLKLVSALEEIRKKYGDGDSRGIVSGGSDDNHMMQPLEQVRNAQNLQKIVPTAFLLTQVFSSFFFCALTVLFFFFFYIASA